MAIFIEVIRVLWQTITGILGAIGTAIWNNLPELLQLKQIMGYFTPAGAIALYLGVPTIVVTITIALIKKLAKG